MKTALHTVSYAGVWLTQARLSLEETISKAAALGFDGIMLMAKRPHASLLDMNAETRRRLKGLMDEKGLSLACIAGYNDFCGGAEMPFVPFREMQVFYITELAKLAHDLGGKVVRIFTGFEHPNISYDQQWEWCVQGIKECAKRAADFGVSIAVQNHHDIAAHYETMYELLVQVDEPNCGAAFDAWTLALQGDDLAQAVRKMGKFIIHTTVADYAKRPRFRHDMRTSNFLPEPELVRAVPMGNGFIGYDSFFAALKEVGYDGFVAYEMCSYLEGGGSEENLDRYAKEFLKYMKY